MGRRFCLPLALVVACSLAPVVPVVADGGGGMRTVEATDPPA